MTLTFNQSLWFESDFGYPNFLSTRDFPQNIRHNNSVVTETLRKRAMKKVT